MDNFELMGLSRILFGTPPPPNLMKHNNRMWLYVCGDPTPILTLTITYLNIT